MTLHNDTTAAPAADFQRPAYVLSDEALLSLSETTLYGEGDNCLWYVEDWKPVGGFWSIAEEVAQATAADAVQISSGQGRAILAMRAFYFLGVLRGGEAYRRLVSIAEEVAQATAADAVQISSGQGRAILAMRAFYFLGVLRGGEAYRRLVAPEEELEKLIDLPFTVYSELFAEDLEAMPPEWMARLLALLGLTVPWAAEDRKGGPEA